MDISSSTRGFRCRVFFTEDVVRSRYGWASDVGGENTRIGNRGFGWWDNRIGMTDTDNRLYCYETTIQDDIIGGHVQSHTGTDSCLVLYGVPYSFRGGTNMSTLHGIGEVRAAAQPGFIGGIEWQVTAVGP